MTAPLTPHEVAVQAANDTIRQVAEAPRWARDDYPLHRALEMLNGGPSALDEIDQLRKENQRLRHLASLGSEIEWEIDKHGDPFLMGVRARVEAGDGFTQNSLGGTQ